MMKILHSNRLLVCLMLTFFSQFLYAQNAIHEKTTENLTQIESPVYSTCDDGIENGDELGVDCGGLSCPPCPCDYNRNPLTIILNFDDYPTETTWRIVDDFTQLTAASGFYYTDDPPPSPNSTIIEYPCILSGCYTFVIRDFYGDGMCCAAGNGSYKVVDGDGNVLAEGGEFGEEETTQFCLSGVRGWATCDPIIDMGDASLFNNTIHAQDKVISGGSVVPQTNVSLKAGQIIHLESGFSVDASANVEINIEDCVPD